MSRLSKCHHCAALSPYYVGRTCGRGKRPDACPESAIKPAAFNHAFDAHARDPRQRKRGPADRMGRRRAPLREIGDSWHVRARAEDAEQIGGGSVTSNPCADHRDSAPAICASVPQAPDRRCRGARSAPWRTNLRLCLWPACPCRRSGKSGRCWCQPAS